MKPNLFIAVVTGTLSLNGHLENQVPFLFGFRFFFVCEMLFSVANLSVRMITNPRISFKMISGTVFCLAAVCMRCPVKLLICVLTFILSVMSVSASAETTTYRDRNGRAVGTAVTHGNTTTYRDRNGRVTGTAVTRDGRTVYREWTDSK